MASVIRFGVSIEQNLLKRFDRSIQDRGFSSRSEAIRDLIRESMIEDDIGNPRRILVGTITIIYNHHIRELSKKLIDLQHHHHLHFLSTLHVHLDHHNCLEVLVVRGQGKLLQQLADKLIGTKGVRYGRLVITGTA